MIPIWFLSRMWGDFPNFHVRQSVVFPSTFFLFFLFFSLSTGIDIFLCQVFRLFSIQSFLFPHLFYFVYLFFFPYRIFISSWSWSEVMTRAVVSIDFGVHLTFIAFQYTSHVSSYLDPKRLLLISFGCLGVAIHNACNVVLPIWSLVTASNAGRHFFDRVVYECNAWIWVQTIHSWSAVRRWYMKGNLRTFCSFFVRSSVCGFTLLCDVIEQQQPFDAVCYSQLALLEPSMQIEVLAPGKSTWCKVNWNNS